MYFIGVTIYIYIDNKIYILSGLQYTYIDNKIYIFSIYCFRIDAEERDHIIKQIGDTGHR